jgi:predicted Zn-dependent protease
MIGIQDFVVAHEIAHHVLDHLSTRPKDDEESRNRERAADEWAIEALAGVGELPLGGFVFCMLMLSARGNDIVFEHLETHPADFRRMDYILEGLVNNLPKLAATALPPGTDIDAFEDQMRQFHQQFRKEFEKSAHEE